MILGVILAAAAFIGVLLLGTLTRPPTYDVAIVVADVPPFTTLTADLVQADTQSLSSAVVAKYILADEWAAMLQAGPVVAVEPLHPGQPLLREQLATGENAGKVRRLSVALTDPALLIVEIPVDPAKIPAVYPGDAVALFFSAGQVQAQQLVTDVVIATPEPNPNPTPLPEVTGPETAVTATVTLQLPLTKWLADGLVYRLNREQQENPNYGAPGMENEPRYIEGNVTGLDVVVNRAAVEWLAFALAHGKVQVGVLPAVAVPQLQAGTLPATRGVTWSDLEDRFFADRPELLKPQPAGAP
jgi:hypothetical protein